MFQVTALCIVLGMLLALSLKTQRYAVGEGMSTRLPALRAEFQATKQENIDLQKQLADYKTRLERLEKEQAAGVSSARSLMESLGDTRLLAGTLPVQGPGVVVTLHDSPKRDPSETRTDIIEDYMVHDSDIRAIVDELFAAGAEAISVNNQRLVANSSIRCVGPVVLVNSVQVAPPYVIKGIGKPDVLDNALRMPGGVAEANGLFLLDMIEIRKITSSTITVPAYTGSTRFKVAQPVSEEKTETKQ